MPSKLQKLIRPPQQPSAKFKDDPGHEDNALFHLRPIAHGQRGIS